MQQEKPVILSLSRDTVLGAEIDNIVGVFFGLTQQMLGGDICSGRSINLYQR